MLETVKSSSSLRKFITNKQIDTLIKHRTQQSLDKLKNYSLNCDHTQACNYLKLQYVF